MFVSGLVLAAGSSSRLGQPKQLLAYRGSTLLDATLEVARECPFDQLLVVLGSAADEVRRRVDLSGVELVDVAGSDVAGLDVARLDVAGSDVAGLGVAEFDAAGSDVARLDVAGSDETNRPGGCSSSLRAALQFLDDRADGMVLLLGDQPGISAATVTALIAATAGAARTGTPAVTAATEPIPAAPDLTVAPHAGPPHAVPPNKVPPITVPPFAAPPIAVCRYRDGRGHPLWFHKSVFDDLRDLRGDKAVWKLLGSGRYDVLELPVDGPIPPDVDTWDDYRVLLDQDSAATAFADQYELQQRLDKIDYLADEGLATALFLACRLGRPLLLEGEPGVGKTAAARAMATALGSSLIRLQCYEGLTAAEALYDWNHQRQLLAIRLAEAGNQSLSEADLYREEYLLERPILQAVRSRGAVPAVLLIDEIDRADDEFEALLLEFLGEHSVTIPELGTIEPTRPPLVILTSNRTRDLHDALKRRCLYHWIDFPAPERAAAIVRRNVSSGSAPLIAAAVDFVGKARGLRLDKLPGLAETIDWVSALVTLGASNLVRRDLLASLGAVAKTPDDLNLLRAGLADLGYPPEPSGAEPEGPQREPVNPDQTEPAPAGPVPAGPVSHGPVPDESSRKSVDAQPTTVPSEAMGAGQLITSKPPP